MTRFDPALRAWVAAIRSTPSIEDAERLLGCFARTATEEWPTALTEIEQLENWTHEGLLAAAMAPKAPPGAVRTGSEDALTGQGYTPSYLLTIRTLQMIGKLALASEQALHLEDLKTALSMMRLMSREWTHFKGELAIEAALDSFEAD